MSNKEIASESLLGERCVEVSRADGIYGYTVFTPLGSKCSCKVYYTTLGCVIWGSRCNLISYKAIHGCYIYHTTVRSRNHGFFSNSSGNLEGSEEVNIHFVHKLLIGYIFGRSNCSGSGGTDPTPTPGPVTPPVDPDPVDPPADPDPTDIPDDPTPQAGPTGGVDDGSDEYSRADATARGRLLRVDC